MSLKQKLKIPVSKYREFYNICNSLIEIDLNKELLSMGIISNKTSAGCVNPVQHKNDLLYRVWSILRYCTENPRGIKNLKKKYSRVRRSNFSSPSKKFLASGFMLRKLTRLCLKNNFLAKNEKGLYTTSNIKQIWVKALEKI